MRLTLPTETLQKALARVAAIPGAKGTPVASTVKLEAGIAGFQLTRLTPEAQAVLDVDGVSLEEEGSIHLSHAELSARIASVSAKEVTLRDDETSLFLEYDFGKKKAFFKVAKYTDDFTLEELEEEKPVGKFTMPSKELAEALEFTALAASTEQARANLCGVRLQKMGGKFAFIGADGRKIHVLFTKLKCEASCTIPTEAVDAIRKALAGDEGKASVQIGEGSISISTDALKMRCQILAESYPTIPDLSALDSAKIIVGSFNREELGQALSSIIPIGEGDYKAVEMEVGKSEAKLSAAGSVSSGEIPVTVSAKKSFHMRLSAENLKGALPWFTEENGSIPIGLHAEMNAAVIQQSDRTAMIALQVTQ